MEFDLFRDRMIGRISGTAPLYDQEQSMSPFKANDRIALLNDNPNPRLGAVMMLVFNKDGKAHFSLIKRPVYDGVHSGQIAFPGGSKDDADKSMEETALRELYEEVGIKANEVEIIGQIEKVYIPPSKFLVTPFVGVLDGSPSFAKDDFEVEEIIEVPMSLLFDESIVKQGHVNVGKDNFKLKVPYFDIFGHMVWGATAIMLSDFKAIMK